MLAAFLCLCFSALLAAFRAFSAALRPFNIFIFKGENFFDMFSLMVIPSFAFHFKS